MPVAALAEEILTPGEGKIRALLTIAGNPVLSTPNGRQLDEALEGLDFMVAVDPYLNETTRHADLILPPTSALEHDHYDLVFSLLAVRNVARYSPPLFRPASDARHDWQILDELRRRLDNDLISARFKRWISARLGPRRLLDLGLRMGPYGSGFRPFGRGLDFFKLRAAPHGIDLGPLEPCLPERLKTPTRRIELAPGPFLDDVQRLREGLAKGEPDRRLLLIGRRNLRGNNSWMHNFPRLMGGKERCTLLLHPDDAHRLEISSGDRVMVTSRTGRVDVQAEISDEVMPGVVSLPHGWGHDRPGTRLECAAGHPGASANDLTDDLVVDPTCGNAVLNGVPVRLERVKIRSPKAGQPTD